MIHQLHHKLSLHHMLQHAISYFAHQVERNELFQASCEHCQASHGFSLASHEMH
jgi:hypothetical protein